VSPRSGVGQYFSWIPGRGASSTLPDLEAPLMGTRRDSFNESDIMGELCLSLVEPQRTGVATVSILTQYFLG
jgi:hypothetical protein